MQEIIRGVLNKLWAHQIRYRTFRVWLRRHDGDCFRQDYCSDGTVTYHWRILFDDWKLYFAVKTKTENNIVELAGGYWEKR